MTSERREAKELDDALDGASTTDETRPLAETADSVRRALASDVPPADRTRALFLSGVTARERTGFSPRRVLVPALAVAVVVFAVFAGQNALPGEQLYPVREALNAVGIGETPLAEVEGHLNEAAGLINEADRALDKDPEKALLLAVRALEKLGPARDLLPELNEERREEKLALIEDLEDRAVDMIAGSVEQRNELEEDAGDEADENDSGSGSEHSGGDDTSGPGSDDDSGSGSDDSGSDDSGSDDSGSDDSGSDDSSGSGSGSED